MMMRRSGPERDRSCFTERMLSEWLLLSLSLSLVLGLSFGVLLSDAQGAQRFVDPVLGLDTPGITCNSSHPCQTIGHAIESFDWRAAPAVLRVTLRAGTYSFAQIRAEERDSNMAAGASLTIAGESRETVILDCAGQGQTNPVWWFEYFYGLQMRDFTMRNCVSNNYAVIYFKYIQLVSVNDVTLEGNSGYRGGGLNGAPHSTGTNLAISGLRAVGNTNRADQGGALHLQGNQGSLTEKFTATITGSHFEGNSCPGNRNGGAVAFRSPSVTAISRTDFVGNSATWDGGALWSEEAATTSLTSCDFLNNTAVTCCGGALVEGSGTVVGSTFQYNRARDFGGLSLGGGSITDSTFARNIVTDEAGGLGLGGTTTVTRGTVSGNAGGDDGPGVYIRGSTSSRITLEQVTIADNIATGSSDGGGIYVGQGATARVIGCAVTGNVAEDGGGLYADLQAQITVNGSRFQMNNASGTSTNNNGRGGGLYASQDSQVIIEGSSFVDNRAFQSGGGIYLGNVAADVDGLPAIRCSTITRNWAELRGGAMHMWSNRQITYELLETEISENWASQSSTSYIGGHGVHCDGQNVGSTLFFKKSSVFNNRGEYGNESSEFTCSARCSSVGVFPDPCGCTGRIDRCSACNGTNECLGCNDVPYADEDCDAPTAPCCGCEVEEASDTESVAVGAIVGIAVGAVCGVLLLALVVAVVITQRKRFRRSEKASSDDSDAFVPPPPPGGGDYADGDMMMSDMPRTNTLTNLVPMQSYSMGGMDSYENVDVVGARGSLTQIDDDSDNYQNVDQFEDGESAINYAELHEFRDEDQDEIYNN